MSCEELTDRLRATAEKCRADAITASDPEVAAILIEIAAELEAGIRRLEDVGEAS